MSDLFASLSKDKFNRYHKNLAWKNLIWFVATVQIILLYKGIYWSRSLKRRFKAKLPDHRLKGVIYSNMYHKIFILNNMHNFQNCYFFWLIGLCSFYLFRLGYILKMVCINYLRYSIITKQLNILHNVYEYINCNWLINFTGETTDDQDFQITGPKI